MQFFCVVEHKRHWVQDAVSARHFNYQGVAGVPAGLEPEL